MAHSPPQTHGPNMISLRPLKADEFAAVAASFLPDYAAEIVANFGIPRAHALAHAAQHLWLFLHRINMAKTL